MSKKSTFFLGLLFFVSTTVCAKNNVIVVTTDTPATVHQSGSIESTKTIDPWKWHTKVRLDTIFVSGLNKRLVQCRQTVLLGFGLPGRFELNLTLPVGYTFSTFSENGQQGAGFGDLRAGLLYNIKDAPRGGIGLLLGFLSYFPTGHNTHLLGEGDLSALAFISASFVFFSSSLGVNLGYRLRPEHHGTLLTGQSFEQDDEVVWRVGLRVPKDEDIAWSLEAHGSIGVATAEGVWPAQHSRTLWVGGGIDYPTVNKYRLGLHSSFLLNGDDRGVLLSVQLSGIAKDRDEDRDGVLRGQDECPLLREDLDGFQDNDGCPDLDNDMDTFPDKEDECPLQKADEFSDNGC